MSKAVHVSVIVLAGGESRRFGTDKISADLDGRTLLDHVLSGLDSGWEVVCVGPERETVRPVTWVREDPPLGGPLAGVAAGLAASTGEMVLVVAGDMPWAAPALPRLLAALRGSPEASAAVALDAEGQANPLLAAYHRSALVDALPTPAHGRRAKLLLELPHVQVPVGPTEGQDVDTPDDLVRWRP